MSWHPRGEASWPGWKSAEPGTRVEHVRSGRQGTFVRAVVRSGSTRFAVIDWDATQPWQSGPSRGRVVAPAFDLRPVDSATDGR